MRCEQTIEQRMPKARGAIPLRASKQKESTMTDITLIPLNRLAVSADNVRKTAAAEGIAELAASIMSHGLQQNLVVRKQGKAYGVIDGGRRLRALLKLAKDGSISENFPVPCKLDESAFDPKEISLVANTLREDMHPADQFEAFKALADKGVPAADIAARRGCPESHVLKLLKLANCSPVLLKNYRAGKLSLDQLIAYAVTDDHTAQERVFREHGAAQPHYIRRLLTAGEVPATDRRVRYVTLKAYEDAGGSARRDLFSDGDEGIYIADAALLGRLVSEKLERAAEKVRREGWKWVEVRGKFEYSEQARFRQIHPEPAPLPAKLAREAEKLAAEYDKLIDDETEHAERLDEIQARLDEIEESREEGEFTPEQKAIAGAVLTVGDNGKTEILRGLVRPEECAARNGSSGASKENGKSKGKASDGQAPGEAAEARPEYSAGLIEDLTAQKSAAISAALMEDTRLALAAVVHALASRTVIAGVSETCLQVSAQREYFKKAEGSRAVQRIAEAAKHWQETLPREPEALWAWCLEASEDDLRKLLAFCAGFCVDAIQTKGRESPGQMKARLNHADSLAKALRLDMREWFTATAENYFSRVGKSQILEAIAEAKGQPAAPALEKLKKGDLAKRAGEEIAGTGWLPKPLRTVA
jgi:ParB family chromosome partitioning protein